ncbi:MAG: diaminopimelate decarboxylase [Gemmatimonadetes bacterium]|nr:diaminopimelate decarboxylase [Gemmatimonadota bacterium]MCH8811498.1 diaminopimelate decarboxylase [Gemmatimonadota bacterium]
MWAGECKVADLVAEFGSPLYVYDARVIEAAYRRMEVAFAGVDLLLAYSVKANSNLEILKRLVALGAGADIVSRGELHRCLTAGFSPEDMVFAGVGKTEAEMEAALAAGILAFNVESAEELELLSQVAERVGKPAPVALRVNPDIVADTPHEYTRTGGGATKFGIPVDRVMDLYRWAADRPTLEIRGIDVHIGSQILEAEPYERALDHVLGLAAQIRAEGIDLDFVDLGGGYGVSYDGGDGMSVEDLADIVVPRVAEAGLRLILEPGRFIVGEAGILVTKVLYVKHSGAKTFVVMDGGMTELIRPSHYQGFHRIEPVISREEATHEVVDVVGPICETGDFLARDRMLQMPASGDLLAVHTTGAYGFVMASNYNSRPKPAEVVVDGAEVTLARRRESLDDLLRGELG